MLGLAGYPPLSGLPLKDKAKGFLSRVIRRKRTFAWNGQPIYQVGTTQDTYRFLAQSLNELMKKERMQISAGQWPLALQRLLPESWTVRTWATLKLDLTQDLDTLWKNFKPAARNKIIKSENAGIYVRQIQSLEELSSYYGFVEKCAGRYNKILYGFEDFSTMWKHFREWGVFETFVAYFEEKPIAGLSVWGTKQEIGELGSFQSEESYQNKWGGGDLIKWKVIQWAHHAGIGSFDLAGVNPAPATQKEIGIRKFKEKWAGSEFQYLILSTQ